MDNNGNIEQAGKNHERFATGVPNTRVILMASQIHFF